MSINVNAVSSPTIASFIRQFYKISDEECEHEAYADSFDYTSALFFQIGPWESASTRQGVLSWRQKAWEKISSRKHTIHDVFAHPQKSNEYMIYGRVDHTLKEGSKAASTWAGRMVFDQKSIDNGDPKMNYYRVWIVSLYLPRLKCFRWTHCITSHQTPEK